MCIPVPGNPTRVTFDCTYLPRIGRKKLTRLGVREIRIVIDQMRRDGVGQRTIQYVHATLRAALERIYREELVTRNVAKLVRVETP